jgi:hypothetical protein
MHYPCLLKRLLRTGLQTVLMFAAFGIAMAGTARAQSSIPQDLQSAVIFTYHHIGDDMNPPANLSREKFISHLEELKSGNYHVLSLSKRLSPILKLVTRYPILPSRLRLMAAIKRRWIMPPRFC